MVWTRKIVKNDLFWDRTRGYIAKNVSKRGPKIDIFRVGKSENRENPENRVKKSEKSVFFSLLYTFLRSKIDLETGSSRRHTDASRPMGAQKNQTRRDLIWNRWAPPGSHRNNQKENKSVFVCFVFVFFVSISVSVLSLFCLVLFVFVCFPFPAGPRDFRTRRTDAILTSPLRLLEGGGRKALPYWPSLKKA